MKKIADILKNNKHAIKWTIGYIIVMWAILYFLFNFNMFDGHMWHRLMHARLHGFAGHVFGLLILAALPLYMASTTLIIRTKKPLIEVPVPKIPLPQFLRPKPKPATDTAPESGGDTPSLGPNEETIKVDLSPDIPAELRPAYRRAHHHMGQLQTSIFNSIDIKQTTGKTNTPDNTPEITDMSGDTFPLPTDFDIPADTNDTPIFTEIPTFSTIDFDTPINQEPETSTETPEPKITNNTQSTDYIADLTQLTEHLDKNNHPYQIIGNLIVTDTQAIACHTDPDFWVIDTENWFASGKVRPSPIAQVTQYANDHELQPVIYLGATNILDLDNYITEWQSAGITVITDIPEI